MAIAHTSQHPSTHRESSSETSLFGFWLYILTDCLLFASLFVTYLVLQPNLNGGPSASELFSLPFVLVETLLLLTSSFTAGIALLAARQQKTRLLLGWLIATVLLGATFLGMELYEFSHMVREGHDWQVSGFLSGYFTLVGMHGLHITAGLLWAIVIGVRLLKQQLTTQLTRHLLLWSLFWHFLDIVWIFIFTFVYLMGVA